MPDTDDNAAQVQPDTPEPDDGADPRTEDRRAGDEQRGSADKDHPDSF